MLIYFLCIYSIHAWADQYSGSIIEGDVAAITGPQHNNHPHHTPSHTHTGIIYCTLSLNLTLIVHVATSHKTPNIDDTPR